MSVFKFSGKTALIIIAFVGSTMLQAKKPDVVYCPSIDKIKQTASLIDTVTPNEPGVYFAYTKAPAFQQSNLPWTIAVQLKSPSQEEALPLARKAIASIKSVYDEKAIELRDDTYFCLYLDSVLQSQAAVIAVGGHDIKLARSYIDKFLK